MKYFGRKVKLLYTIVATIGCSMVNMSCSVSQNIEDKTLVILHTNDTHSQIEPTNEDKAVGDAGGVLRRKEYVDQMRKEYSDVLLLDAGDFSQGTPYYNLFKGESDVYFMNQLGYDVVTLGNHEFDDGAQHLANRLKKANFTIVCANYSFKNKDLAHIVKKYTVIEKAGIKIGIFGLTKDLNRLSAADKILDTAIYRNAIDAAKEVVLQLKKENCDLIICLSHLGFVPDNAQPDNPITDQSLAKEVGDIDIIISGHSHLDIDTAINGVKIVQNDDKGKTIGFFKINEKK